MVVFDVKPIDFYPMKDFGEVELLMIKNKTNTNVKLDIYSGRKSNTDNTRVLVIDILEPQSCKEKVKTR